MVCMDEMDIMDRLPPMKVFLFVFCFPSGSWAFFSFTVPARLDEAEGRCDAAGHRDVLPECDGCSGGEDQYEYYRGEHCYAFSDFCDLHCAPCFLMGRVKPSV